MFSKHLLTKFPKLCSLNAVQKTISNKNLHYVRTARFGILEDKLADIRKQAFERIDASKGDVEKEPKPDTKFSPKFNLFDRSMKSDTMQEYSIAGLTLDQTINRLKVALEQKEKSYGLYYSILDRFQDIIINEPETTGKHELLKILRALNYYRPKDEERVERQARNMGYVKKSHDKYSKPHMKYIKQEANKSVSPIGHGWQHIRDNFEYGKIKGLISDISFETEDALSKSIYDVIEVYKTLFRNIELVFQEELNRKNIDHREALDILVGFSIAGEATNIFLERLFEIIYPNIAEGNYDTHDLELILSHFPQDFWENSYGHGHREKEFNHLISSQLSSTIDEATPRQLLSFFQAFSQTPNFPKEMLNKLLNKFAGLLEEKSLSKEEFLNFIEIYAMMVKRDSVKGIELDNPLLFKIISSFLDHQHEKGVTFSMQEVSELFWVYATCGILQNKQNAEIVKSLESVLNTTLAEYIAKYKDLSEADRHEGETQELFLHEDDVKGIVFYYEQFSQDGALQNAGEVVATLKDVKEKYDDRPENERKWFVW